MNCLTLYELNSQVRATIESNFVEPLWIQAELSSVSTRGAHCYLEFVQKSETGNTFIAKAKGQIWSNKWIIIRPYFERATGQPLSVGMQVMVQVEVTFHEQYGYSLNVVDINPTFTLGDIARKRQEILRKLEEEGVINLNKEMKFPQLMQRIAVISSESAAGWGDFLNQLNSNEYGLAFCVQLFPAIMQGEKVEQTIICALNQIAVEQDRWDVVVIIRGGGAMSDLTGFDTFSLAENVAQFPIPVITGIGHERDETVLDMISHTRVKTPTAAAEFLIHHQLGQLVYIQQLSNSITDGALVIIHQEKLRVERLKSHIPSLFNLYKMNQLHLLDAYMINMRAGINSMLDSQKYRLELIMAQLNAASPENMYRLGFSVVRLNGKAVRDASRLKEGDRLKITLEKGSVDVIVKNH